MDGSYWPASNHRPHTPETDTEWRGAGVVAAIGFAAFGLVTALSFLLGGDVAILDIPAWWIVSADT